MKKYSANKLIIYLIKEFTLSLVIMFGVFISLIFLTSFVDELIFLKQIKNLDNIFLKTLFLTSLKSPGLLINLSPFIFLFSGILFFVKFKKNNELSSLNLLGFSDNFITLIPSTYSFFLGLFLIFFLSPISSYLIKHYEITKQRLSNNDSLIILSNTGIWIKEVKDSNTHIIRADKIDSDNFSKLNNATIYIMKNKIKVSQILMAKKIDIEEEKWTLHNVKEISENKVTNIKKMNYYSEINLNELKTFFTNSNIFSVWNLLSELKKIKQRGYYGQEIVITFNKYISLPIMLFCMVVISTIFTLKTNTEHNYFIYSFYGVSVGIFVYFLSDLSIALGKTGRVPLALSVWMPIILLIGIVYYRLKKNNE